MYTAQTQRKEAGLRAGAERRRRNGCSNGTRTRHPLQQQWKPLQRGNEASGRSGRGAVVGRQGGRTGGAARGAKGDERGSTRKTMSRAARNSRMQSSKNQRHSRSCSSRSMGDDNAHSHIKTKANVTKHIASSFGVALSSVCVHFGVCPASA